MNDPCSRIPIDCWVIVAEYVARGDLVWFAMACWTFMLAAKRARRKLDTPIQSVVESRARMNWALLRMLDRTWTRNNTKIYHMIPVMAAQLGNWDALHYAEDMELPFISEGVLRAAARGDVTVAKWYFEHPLLPKTKGRPKLSMFDLADRAAESGSLDMAKWVHKKYGVSCKMVETAATHGHLDIVKYLVQRNDTIEIEAFDKACRNKQIHVARYILEHGGLEHFRPLRWGQLVVRTGSMELVMVTESLGIDITGEATLCDAVASGNVMLCEYLYNKGIGGGGSAGAAEAAEAGNIGVLDWVVSKGTKPVQWWMDRALHNEKPDPAMIRWLLTHGLKADKHVLITCARINDLGLLKEVAARCDDWSHAIVGCAIDHDHKEMAVFAITQGCTVRTVHRWTLRAKWPDVDWKELEAVSSYIRKERKMRNRKRKRDS